MLFLLPLWTHALNIVDVLRSLVKFPIWVVSGRLFKLDLFDMTLKEKKKKKRLDSEVIKVQSLHGICGSRVENIYITKLEGLFKIFHWIG